MAAQQALEGKRYTAFGVDPNALIVVGLDTDHAEGTHPLWDERIKLPVSEELVRSLSKYGNVHDVVVRKETDGEKRPLVVFGRQRVRAMRVANERLAKAGQPLKLLRARHERSDDLTALGQAITENAVRRGDSPMAKARKLKQMTDLGASDPECAVAFGVSTTAIRQWKKMLNLAPEVQEAVDTGEISSSAAMNFADFEPAEQVAQLETDRKTKAVTGKKPTFQSTKRTRQNAAKGGGTQHKTAFVPPRKPVLKKIAVFAAPDSTEHEGPTLSSDSRAMLDWVLGKVDASTIPGLSEVLATIEKSKDGLSKAQQEILDLLDGTEGGAVLGSDPNKKTLDALVKRGLIERFEHADGLEYVRRVGSTDSDADGATSDDSDDSAADGAAA